MSLFHTSAQLIPCRQSAEVSLMQRLLRYSDLKPRGIGFSRVHLARLEGAGRFPKRIRIGDNSIAWVESEVEQWLRERMAARSATAAPTG